MDSECCICCCCCVCLASALGRIPCLAGCFSSKNAKDVEDDDEIVYPMADTNQRYRRPDRMRPPDPSHPPNGASYPRTVLPNPITDGANHPPRDVRSPPPPYGVNSPSLPDGRQEGHGRSPSAQGPPPSLQPGHPPSLQPGHAPPHIRSPSSERAH